jgi:hypothetical protein
LQSDIHWRAKWLVSIIPQFARIARRVANRNCACWLAENLLVGTAFYVSLIAKKCIALNLMIRGGETDAGYPPVCAQPKIGHLH